VYNLGPYVCLICILSEELLLIKTIERNIVENYKRKDPNVKVDCKIIYHFVCTWFYVNIYRVEGCFYCRWEIYFCSCEEIFDVIGFQLKHKGPKDERDYE